ncbi:MAG: hypothetical protein ISS36_00955 [Candidatus Aenigmarchaeota archaeon]|nr:hypothetical protein [Candidatus Aenigmarchaeota archaeon]
MRLGILEGIFGRRGEDSAEGESAVPEHLRALVEALEGSMDEFVKVFDADFHHDSGCPVMQAGGLRGMLDRIIRSKDAMSRAFPQDGDMMVLGCNLGEEPSDDTVVLNVPAPPWVREYFEILDSESTTEHMAANASGMAKILSGDQSGFDELCSHWTDAMSEIATRIQRDLLDQAAGLSDGDASPEAAELNTIVEMSSAEFLGFVVDLLGEEELAIESELLKRNVAELRSMCSSTITSINGSLQTGEFGLSPEQVERKAQLLREHPEIAEMSELPEPIQIPVEELWNWPEAKTDSDSQEDGVDLLRDAIEGRR